MKNITNVGINILVNNNKCKIHSHEGKFFVEAKLNSEYEIEIENKSYGRILAAPVIDGLSVLDGNKPGAEPAGYVLAANSTYRVKGFRVDDDTVAAFRFGKKEDSYAASKSKEQAENVGIIEVACWSEYQEAAPNNWWQQYHPPTEVWPPFPQKPRFPKQPFPKEYPWYSDIWCTITSNGGANGSVTTRSFDTGKVNGLGAVSLMNCGLNSGPMNMSCGAETVADFAIGTSFGDAKESKVFSTKFKNGDFLGRIEIYYANRESLIKMGVPLNVKTGVVFPKSAFSGYCTPPKNWASSK